MKSYDKLEAKMEAIQKQMAGVKKNERSDALEEVQHLCKESGYTHRMRKGSLAEGRKQQGSY